LGEVPKGKIQREDFAIAQNLNSNDN